MHCRQQIYIHLYSHNFVPDKRPLNGCVCVCYSHKLQLQNNKLKKTKEKRHTTCQKHNLSSAYYICTTEAQGNINIGNRWHGNAHYLTAKTFNLAKATAVAGGTFSDTGRLSSRRQCSLPGVINANALESVLCITWIAFCAVYIAAVLRWLSKLHSHEAVIILAYRL